MHFVTNERKFQICSEGQGTQNKNMFLIKALSTSPTKWSNTLKQFVGGRRIVLVCLPICGVSTYTYRFKAPILFRLKQILLSFCFKRNFENFTVETLTREAKQKTKQQKLKTKKRARQIKTLFEHTQKVVNTTRKGAIFLQSQILQCHIL